MRLIREVVDHAIDLRIRDRHPATAVVVVILPAYMRDRIREELAMANNTHPYAFSDATVSRYFREAHHIRVEFGPPPPTIDFHDHQAQP